MPTCLLDLTVDGEHLVDDAGFAADDLLAARRHGVRHVARVLRAVAQAAAHAVEGTLLDAARNELIRLRLVFSTSAPPEG